MSMPALRVALYARVSSEQQTEQGTIASQVTALEAKIVEDGLHLEPDYRFIDEGYSGATLVRPALERLRDRVAAGGRRSGLRPFSRSPGPPLCLSGLGDR